MSLRRLGKCASDGLRPRAAKLSRQIRPCSNSRVPLRIVSRFQPRSRSARRCPPDPSSLTVRAMNNRRALPFSALAVSMNKALNESVNSIVGPPALLSLECMIHHLGWFNFCVSLIHTQALHTLGHMQAKELLLDITGVPVVDSQVAQGLLQLVEMAKLMGTRVSIVGIRPEVAQAIVGLGLD